MKKEGFSLIEIIIALFVASAIFSAALPLIFNTISANKLARLKVNAYQAAQREIENIKTTPLSELQTHSFTAEGVPDSTSTLSVTLNDPELAEITSRVAWNFRGKDEVVQLKTYLYGAAE